MKIISNERAKQMCEAVLTQEQIEKARAIAGDRPGQNMHNLSRLSEYGNSIVPHDITRENYLRILRWLEKYWGLRVRAECADHIIDCTVGGPRDMFHEYQNSEAESGPWASPYWIAQIVVWRDFNKLEYEAAVDYCDGHGYDWRSIGDNNERD